MALDKDRLREEEEASFVRFCKIILGWDYFGLLTEAAQKQKKERGKGGGSGLRQVKNTYKDVDDYLATFEPLLFEEVKAQIIQKKDDEEVTEWVLRLVVECNESEGFLLPSVTYGDDEGEKIVQNDLLLLSEDQFKEGGGKFPQVYAFALVEQRQHNLLRLRMFLAGEVMNLNTDVIESRTRLLKMHGLITSPGLLHEKRLFSLKICSLSTISREYFALRSIGSLPFKDLILAAADKSSGSEDQAWKVSQPLSEHFQGSLNKSQMEAIDAGLLRKAFVLIQGPPGTGKTQTILALLSAILHATPTRVHTMAGLHETKRGSELPIQEKYNHWARASPWWTGNNPRDKNMPKDGDDGFFPTSGNDFKPEVIASSRKYHVRVLVCAPSNSALDEIVLRLLKTGVHDENVRSYNPKIVRIGLKAHHSVQSVCMDNLVKQKQGESASDKQKHRTAGGDIDSIRAAILEESVIVFSTLSFSGSALFSKLNHGFDVVIIDEAAQAVEPATLVPLVNGCKQVFLVGDPVQLPATVISPTAGKFGYGTSLFERFQRAGYPVNMLKMQYRMHPEIRSFPSSEFYAEALQDADDLERRTTRDWHQYHCFGPFCFFDVHEGKESQPSGSGSWVNVDEVEFVLLLYHKLVTMYPELRSSSQFAIISPYRHQVKLFQDRFQDAFGQESKTFVDIQTVDGFQGREKDVAIFSCVRSNDDRRIGFVSDARRMNVGITRAKSSVLVVGSASTLRNDEHWNNLVESAEKRNVLFKVSKPYSSFFSDSNLNSMKVERSLPDGLDTEDMEINELLDVHRGHADEEQAEDNDLEDGEMDGGGYDED
ncbi:PREDICTED: probable helicase MAGATAMA 3 isoform X1 [Populus euphratica]|uniref:Probable helicase MAGATAMA 3 isoform X1 n=1 Tax=Populus euphratica TaxID=75702 RepID=A0AAJ6V5Z9_POPEU|nr:PREDICTED: probable helicase MAGATAMA 3 isoform X1 [Populus euphratica]